jgi:hypothetical protein
MLKLVLKIWSSWSLRYCDILEYLPLLCFILNAPPLFERRVLPLFGDLIRCHTFRILTTQSETV